MSKKIQSIRQRLWAAWMSVQVEFHGRYSVERLQHLDRYSNSLSIQRLVAIFLVTPLPSLALSLLKEIPPLNPPEAGVYDNKVFFVRSWFVLAFIGGNVLIQMGQCAPRLKLTTLQLMFATFFSSAVAMAVIFTICVFFYFPMPFGLLIVSPPDVIMITLCFVYISGPRWRADPALWNDVKRQLSVFNCQVALTFVYPIYIYGFVSLTGIHQALFVIILPVIQLIAKNWVSREHTDSDLKPEGVIFIVEVFNALYVSNALHNTTAWTTTATIMAVDFIHFWLSMLDVIAVLNEVKLLMGKIPRGHPIAKENFVQVSMRLLEIERVLTLSAPSKTHSTNVSNISWNSRMDAWVSSKNVLSKSSSSQREASLVTRVKSGTSSKKKCVFPVKARVFPVRPPKQQKWLQSKVRFSPVVKEPDTKALVNFTDLGLETIYSREERALFIRKSARVLFITEYIVLVEYTEVILPIVYSLHQAILFHMHNRAYYPALAKMSSVELFSSIVNVLIYSALEFVSLVVALVVLKRRLGFSTIRQLAFVLETHASMVQSKLTTLFVYVMQVPLAHLGADFSFKFAWIHK